MRYLAKKFGAPAPDGRSFRAYVARWDATFAPKKRGKKNGTTTRRTSDSEAVEDDNDDRRRDEA